jgi:beta-lactamase superfamily II metal-dependent hydrolase
MLFDCNVTTDNEDDIIAFLDKVIPEEYNVDKEEYEKPIHIFVNSHRDEDHYRGLKKVNERFPIKSIWDSGQTGATTNSTDYQYYMYLRRKLKAKNPNNLFVPVPSNLSIVSYGGVEIFCLAAEEDFIRDYINKGFFESSTRIQHTNSMVLLLEYGGKKLLMTGDSDWKSWRDKIVPNFNEEDFLKSTILIASHHGSRSFFTSEENDDIDIDANPETTYIESIELIKPDITLISCGEYNSAHHPNKDALKLYKEHTSEEQVYTTFNANLSALFLVITTNNKYSKRKIIK